MTPAAARPALAPAAAATAAALLLLPAAVFLMTAPPALTLARRALPPTTLLTAAAARLLTLETDLLLALLPRAFDVVWLVQVLHHIRSSSSSNIQLQAAACLLLCCVLGAMLSLFVVSSSFCLYPCRCIVVGLAVSAVGVGLYIALKCRKTGGRG